MRGTSWATIALLIAFLGTSILPPGDAIYGGEPAEEGEHPFMVHLFIDEPHDGIVCGGTLIAPTIVLTAGHCIVGDRSPREQLMGYTPQDMSALIGRADLEGEGGETIRVKAGHIHPDYNVNPYNQGILAPQNDVGILELESPSSYAAARYATDADTDLYPPGTLATVIGWGCTPEVCFPSELMEVEVPVWSDADCAAAPNYMIMFHAETELCAGADGQDSCGGDSGGPLFVYDETGDAVVFGIVNYGAAFEVNTDDPFAGFVPCGSGQHPGVYAEVAAFEDFVAPFV